VNWADLDLPADNVAPRLLGSILERDLGGELLRVRIVETEAYSEGDAASHSYRGQTPRTAVMFGPSGFVYVYFTYGMHYCMNVVCGPTGSGAAVLIRAVEPLPGQDIMRARRGGRPDHELTNGPAKLCQALDVTRDLSGHDLRAGELRLQLQPPLDPAAITQTTRIGISQAKEVPWRFYVTDSPYVSKR
jgi:DNA-3-methyladenine glycosylase